MQRITQDPVVLDFVQLTNGAKERDLEAALLEDDRSTVGFILCAGRNEAVAHFTLQGIATPTAGAIECRSRALRGRAAV